MKLAVTADIHFSAYAQDTIIDGLPERLGSLKNTVTNIIEECQKRRVNEIVFAGDLCHNKSIIHTSAQDVMLNIFQDEKYKDLRFYVIDGNHDLSAKGNESVSALRSLETIDNVRWISHQSKGELGHGMDNVLFVPYYPGMKEYITKSTTKADILISHFGLNEGMLSSGISIQSSIKASNLKKFKLVVLGHYHLPQHMVYGKTNIYYTGSPIQLDWGEKNEEKRFLIIDTETFDVESILTTGYNQYCQFDVDADNKIDVLKEAKNLRDRGHHVKLNTKEKLTFDDGMEKINVVEDLDVDITNRGITANMDETTRHKKYLEIKEIPKAEHKKYLDTAKRIMDTTELPE
jgi:DNA repair exonuclease SbcCD nuclease subunit